MYCQALDKVIADFSRKENVEKINIGKIGWNFLKFASVGKKDLSIMKKINSLHLIDLSSCSEETKSLFTERIDKLKDDSYELLLKVKDDEDDIVILSKTKKNKIRELIIIDKNEPMILRLKGKFDLNDLNAVKSFKL